MTQNFFGRDPMVWWIGKVTSPKDGKWENTLEKKHMENGEEAQQPAIFATLHRQDFQDVEENYEPNSDFDNSLATEIKDGVGKNNYNEGKKKYNSFLHRNKCW